MKLKSFISRVLNEIQEDRKNENIIDQIYSKLQEAGFRLHVYNLIKYCEKYYYNYATIQVTINKDDMVGNIHVYYDSELINDVKARTYSKKIDVDNPKSVEKFIGLVLAAKKYIEESEAIYTGIDDK